MVQERLAWPLSHPRPAVAAAAACHRCKRSNHCAPTVCGYEQPTKQRQQLPAHMVPKQGWMHDSQAAMPLTTAAIRPSALHAGKPACHRLLALRTESLNKGMHGAAANTSMLRLTLA